MPCERTFGVLPSVGEPSGSSRKSKCSATDAGATAAIPRRDSVEGIDVVLHSAADGDLLELGAEQTKVPMDFNHKLADEILRDTDRDVARFFAGREEELERFEDSLDVATRRKQTVFHVVQGAPGAGKSSLLEQIHKLHGDRDDLIFVELNKDQLSSVTTMNAAMAKAAMRSLKLGTEAVSALTMALGVESLGDFLNDRIENVYGEMARKRRTLVLRFDEAQNLDERQQDALDELHKNGVGGGMRSVFLLAGLSPTRSVLASLGVSRQAYVDPNRRDLGLLANEECAESTRMMLHALRADASPREDAIVKAVAGLSLGWPAHLFMAQKELTRELKALDGNLSQVNMGTVQQKADKARIAYYEDRVAEPPLSLEPNMLCRILCDVEDANTNALGAMFDIAKHHLEGAGLANRVTDEDYIDALIRKSVIHVGAGRDPKDSATRYRVSVPSMLAWARDRVRELARESPSKDEGITR